MRATFVVLISVLLCHSYVQGSTFILKSGKSLEGQIRYEDASTFRIFESSGLEMTLRKSELNLPATTAANMEKRPEPIETLAPQRQPESTNRRTIPTKVFTNRDVRRSSSAKFSPPKPESKQSWQKAVAKLEREFVRLQGACRAAGTGPGMSKILKSHTYTVNGKEVRVTGYWADPANIAEAKQICELAIATEEALESARRDYQTFLNSQNDENSLTGR